MDDIKESLNRAMCAQGWLFGDKMSRLGHPFLWVDGDQQGFIYLAKEVRAVMLGLSMFYEEYETPQEIRPADYEKMLGHVRETLSKTVSHFAPFLSEKPEWLNYVHCSALTRTQDYCAIKTYAKELGKNIKHLDIGPGLGGHAIYSLAGFNSTFYALEASPLMYATQRQFLRFLSANAKPYLDLVECENFGLQLNEIQTELNSDKYGIKQVPSWHFPLIPDSSLDLISATWVLNEVNHSAILWLMAHSIRSLKKGGYVYIRDSRNLKPQRHQISYDQLLLEHGFKEAGKLEVKNRINFFGHPRVYQKCSEESPTFEQLVEEYLGKFAIVAHSGAYNQNLDLAPRQG